MRELFRYTGFMAWPRRQCRRWVGLMLCLPILALASEPDDGADDALQALLGELEQQTEIATRSKMNVDFVPGIVSVLYGEDMLDRGVRNAAEALALIPGIELSISSDGTTQVFVRGIGSVFASGKIKVMLNDVAFNSTLSVATTALAIPVEQIERIEVIRGPGSAIYGEFAYSGVVNIVTREQQEQVYARYGEWGRKTLGGVFTLGKPGEDWYTSLSLSASKKDGGGVQTGPDVLRGTPITRAPGETNEEELDRTLILQTGFGDFDFSVQWSEVQSGDYFGLAYALPGNGQHLIRDVDMLAVDAGWRFSMTEDFTGRLRVGWLDYSLDSGLHQLYPPNFAASFPNGVIASPNHEERKYHVGMELNYAEIKNHDILMGASWYQTKQGDVFAIRNYDPNTNPPTLLPLQKYTGNENWLGEDLQRRLWAVFIQDQFNWSEQLTLTGGIRFDSYDDVGDATSPRIAAVYHLSELQTLKVQYARAFRPPTFLEVATKNNAVVIGNPDIESEIIDNYELGYIYNDGRTVGRATLFYADLHNLIVADTTTNPNTYANKGEVHVRGVELEFVRRFGRKFTLDGNITLQKTKDGDVGKPVADVADVLANLGLGYQFNRHYHLAAQYRYVGDRQRVPMDTRGDLPGYDTVDVTLSMKYLFEDAGWDDMDFRVGVKNLFDTNVVYPAPVTSFNGSIIPSYPQDYPRPGREYWVQMDIKF